MRIGIVLATLLLSGCASTYEAVQVGPNRYQTSAMAAPARGGAAGAQQMAMQAAGKKCLSLGKMVNVISVDTGHEFPVNGTATVVFECN